jgi:hypothetical protein
MLRPEKYLVDYAGAAVVYPLSDITSGTVAPAFPANTAYDGTVQSGVTLQSVGLGVDCADRLAPEFGGGPGGPTDSTPGAVTLPSAALISGGAFDILHGGVFLIAHANPTAVGDNVRRRLISFGQTGDNNNVMDIQKHDGGELWYRFNADGVNYGSTLYGLTEGVDIEETFSVALTWDFTAHEIKFYINGVERETLAYNQKWYLYNGHPSGFTMHHMEIGGNRSGGPNYNVKLPWDGQIIYPTLFAGAAPSGDVIAKTHAALVS